MRKLFSFTAIIPLIVLLSGCTTSAATFSTEPSSSVKNSSPSPMAASSSSNVSRSPTPDSTSNEPNPPIFVFIDDDGWQADETILAPIFESRGLRATLAIPPGQLKDNNDPTAHPTDIMTTAQVVDLYNRGFDIQSHTWTHNGYYDGEVEYGLTSLTDAELDEQLAKPLEWFSEHGISGVHHLIYPRGDYDDRVVAAASKYYESGITTTMGLNYLPLPTFAMQRVSIASTTPLQTTLDQVDKAFAQGGVCIFMSHIVQSTPADLLETVLDYVISHGGEILTYSQMWDRLNAVS